MDSSELLKSDDQDYKPGYTYIKKTQPDGTVKVITCIAIDYLCECLCDMAEQFYNGWLISRILMPTRFGVNEMFPLTSKMNNKFPLTQDINSGVSGHVETVVLLSQLKQK